MTKIYKKINEDFIEIENYIGELTKEVIKLGKTDISVPIYKEEEFLKNSYESIKIINEFMKKYSSGSAKEKKSAKQNVFYNKLSDSERD